MNFGCCEHLGAFCDHAPVFMEVILVVGGLVGGYVIGGRMRTKVHDDAIEASAKANADTHGRASTAAAQGTNLLTSEVVPTVMLIGDASTGKSLFIERLTNKDGLGRETLMRTMAPNWRRADVSLPAGLVSFQILDTPGALPELSVPFLRHAHAVVLVFDVGSAQSFSHLKDQWYTMVREHRLDFLDSRNAQSLCVVLAHVIDERRERQVTRRDAARWCSTVGLPYFETNPTEQMPKVLTHLASATLGGDSESTSKTK